MYKFPDYQPEIFSTPLKGTVTKAIAPNAEESSAWPAIDLGKSTKSIGPSP